MPQPTRPYVSARRTWMGRERKEGGEEGEEVRRRVKRDQPVMLKVAARREVLHRSRVAGARGSVVSFVVL